MALRAGNPVAHMNVRLVLNVWRVVLGVCHLALGVFGPTALGLPSPG